MSNRDEKHRARLWALLNRLRADLPPAWGAYAERSSVEAAHFVKIRAAFAAKKVK